MKKYILLILLLGILPSVFAIAQYGGENGAVYNDKRPTTIINGSGSSSSNPFDQSLNTTDNVTHYKTSSEYGEFNTLAIHSIIDFLGNPLFVTGLNTFYQKINFGNGIDSLISRNRFIDLLIDSYTNGDPTSLKFNSVGSTDESTISANDTDLILYGNTRNIYFENKTNIVSSGGGNSSWNETKADLKYIQYNNISSQSVFYSKYANYSNYSGSATTSTTSTTAYNLDLQTMSGSITDNYGNTGSYGNFLMKDGGGSVAWT